MDNPDAYDPAAQPWPPPPDWLHSPDTRPEDIDSMFAGVHPDMPVAVGDLHPHVASAAGVAPADQTVGYVDDGKFVPAKPGPYATKLSPKDEQEFQSWVKANKVPFDPSDKADYDMRGFWQAQKNGDPDAKQALNASDGAMHFPDTYKTPYHATFSDESKYATPLAPTWQGDKLVDRNGNVVADESARPSVDWDQSLASATVVGPQLPPSPLPGVVDGLGAPGSPQSPDTGTPPGTPPDAISGAGGYPMHPLEVPLPPQDVHQGGPYGVPAVGPMPLDAQGQLVTTPKPPQPEGILKPYTDAELEHIARTDPQQALRILLDDRQNRTAHGALLEAQQQAEERAAIQKDAADRQAAMAVVQKKQDENTAAITAWSHKMIDPNRRLDSRSFLGKFIDGIGAFAASAGAGPGAKGNSYIDWLQDDIKNDIKAQENNLQREGEGLQQKTGILAQEFARTGSMSDAKHVATMALLGTARAGLITKMQEFDPAGTRVTSYLQGLQQIDGAIAAHQDAQNELNFKNAMDFRKADNADAETMVKFGELALKRDEFNAKQAKAGAAAPTEKPQYGAVYPTLDAVPAKFQKFAFRLPGKNGQLGGYVIAGNEKNQEKAEELSQSYGEADWDLNELQKISLRRKGAKSTGGSFNDKWSSTDEQNYKSLLIDVANVYGKMIHGRAPTAGVMDEVMLHSIPELKAAWEGGDTTALIDRFRNAIDNRTTLELNALGSDARVTSDRPKIEEPNANTIKAPLVAAPVKGDAGYGHVDIANFDGQLKQLFEHHLQNPSLGGQKGYEADLADIERKQGDAVMKISGDLAALTAKPKKTPQDLAQIRAATAAIADRTQAIDAIHDARKRSIEHERNQAALREANKKPIIQTIRHR